MNLSRFIAGSSIKNVIPIANRVLNNNNTPIINYVIEEVDNPMNVFTEYRTLINNINNRYKISIKISSFGFDEDLLYTLIECSKWKNIRVIIDAEENKYNDHYQEISNYLIRRHNKEYPYIIKTYQMYRKDALDTLTYDIQQSYLQDYHLGINLVRGTYFFSDKNQGDLFTDKKLTDNSYNLGIRTLSKYKFDTLLSTHNEESIRLGCINNIFKPYPLFEFAHLMGMHDDKFKDIANTSYNVNTYIPYGPYSKTIPYLTRVLHEKNYILK